MNTLNDNHDKHLEKEVCTTLKQRQHVAKEYCGHEETMVALEAKLWEYAEGLMDEEEDENFWNQTRNCPCCLQKLLTIQTALNEVQQQELPSAEELLSIVQQRKQRYPLITITARLLENTLHVVKSVYREFREKTSETMEQFLEPQYATPVPALGEEETSSAVVSLKQQVGSKNIDIELEKVTDACCDLTLRVSKTEQNGALREFSVLLYDADRQLVASRLVRDGYVTFQALGAGMYTLQVEEADTVLVEIALNIEPDNGDV